MAGFITNAGALGLQDGSIDWAANTIKARLVNTTEVIDQDAIYMTGIGLPATDITLGTKTGPTKDDATNRVAYGCANPSFSGVSGVEKDRIAVFKFVTNDADSILIAIVDITPQEHVTPTIVTVTLAGGVLFYTQQ